jgi:hypothetical protein
VKRRAARRWRRARVLLRAIPPLLGLTAAAACSARPSLVGPGGECFLASDCVPGLICIEQRGGTRVCTDDLSRVAGEPPPREDAGDPEAGDAAVDADGPDDAGLEPETGDQDTGADTGADADAE